MWLIWFRIDLLSFTLLYLHWNRFSGSLTVLPRFLERKPPCNVVPLILTFIIRDFLRSVGCSIFFKPAFPKKLRQQIIWKWPPFHLFFSFDAMLIWCFFLKWDSQWKWFLDHFLWLDCLVSFYRVLLELGQCFCVAAESF